MKKLIYIIVFIFILCPKSIAQDSPDFIKELHGYVEYNQNNEQDDPRNIYLEPEAKKFINISQPQSIKSNSLNLKKNNFEVFSSDMSKISAFTSRQEHIINSKHGSTAHTFRNITFGTEYDSSLDDGEITYMTGIYTKFDSKRAALTLSARTETGNAFSYYTDKIVIAPELKLTNRLSILDIAQTDTKQVSQKNEIVLRYNPKIKNHTDDLFFELGAGNSYREMEYVKSSIRFSTKFKF